MTIRGKAHIAGAYEHPDRKIPDKSVAQVHAEVALGAVADAGQGFAVAGLVTFLPPALVMVLFWLLPETRGREPEDLWPTT